MQQLDRRILVAVLTYFVWASITIFGARLVFPEVSELSNLVQSRFGWQFLIAIAFLAAVIVLNGWKDLSLFEPVSLRNWGLLWFPLLFVVMFLAGAIAAGPPALSNIGWVLLNTFLVGVSEELMFRGVLFRALLSRLSFWVSLVVTSVLFGSVHILNVFLTGGLLAAASQSIAAGFSGVLFAALVVRTGSLIPAIILHWLWDFSVFLFSLSASGSGLGQGNTVTGVWSVLLPITLVLPNLLYGLYLLRASKRPQSF